MLCRRPSVKECVFPTFEVSVHVREDVDEQREGDTLWLGVDFGFSAPFVCLFIREDRGGATCVVDEYVQPGQIIEEHIRQVSRRWGTRPILCCDPAGAARNEQTATSNVAMLRRAGFVVRKRSSGIVDGLDMIRRALRNGERQASLFIHPRCKRLIRAMQSYRYPPGGGELPVKDGTHDHLIDALRYSFINREGGQVRTRMY